MLDLAVSSAVEDAPGEAIAEAEVVRIDLQAAEFSIAALQRVLDKIATSGRRPCLVARIAATAAGPVAAHLARIADGLEIWVPAGIPATVVAALHSVAVGTLVGRFKEKGTDRVAAVFEVDRRLVGHLASLVETAAADGFTRVEFEPRIIKRVGVIEESIFFDRERFNDDLDSATQEGKLRGIVVAGIKFGSQGPMTATSVPGHRRTLVMQLGKRDGVGQEDSVIAFFPRLRHFELEGTHFHPSVIETGAFRTRKSALSADHDLIARFAPLFRRYSLDPTLYLDVANRLAIDLCEVLTSGGRQAIQALNGLIERRFRKQTGPGNDCLIIDLTKPFLGYNWDAAQSFLLPDQYQFRRYFNESQTPTVLLRVNAGYEYRIRTVIHDATPGNAVDFLQLSCNDFIPIDQAIRWEGRHCVHVCTVPARIINVAQGKLRVSYAIARKSENGGLARMGLRLLAVDPLHSTQRPGKMTVFRSMVARAIAGARVDRPSDEIGQALSPETDNFANFPNYGDEAVAAVRALGFAVAGKEEVIAAIGLELAELAACGMVVEAARQMLFKGRNVESNSVAWIKPSPVEHRYTGTEAVYQFFTMLKGVLTLRRPVAEAIALLQKLTDIDPASRPGWLALADCQIEVGANDAAIHSARCAVHHDVCCIVSQEALRRAYLAKYPRATEPVIDGVPVYDLTDRFCSVPFDRIETAKDGIVWTCCPAWLGAPIGNMHRMRWEDAWNSDQAALIRQSILEGDFKYCNKGVCPAILANNLPRKSEVTDPHFRHYIDNKLVKLPEGPREISLSHDPSCNLACPQCRNDFILANDEQNAEFAATIDAFIKPLIEFAQLDKSAILMSGDGEIFVSPHYRAIFKLFDPEKHSGITLNLLSNGLVFESGWEKAPNIHKLVRSVTVSTDAASEMIYRLTRGGSWAKLYRNLEYVSGLRRRREIQRFGIHYAVQTCNYKDMRRMVEIGQQLGVDRIAFAILRNGGTYDSAEYATRAVFEPDHPEHVEFIRELDDPIFRSPIVDITQFAGFLGDRHP